MTRAGYDHIEVLIDRSGSMVKIVTDMEGGLATFIRDQRALPGRTATIAVRQFDDQYETVLQPIDIKDVALPIRISPRGSTALLDAMGKAIVECGQWLMAKAEDDRPERVYFVVITDGLENASKEWNRESVMNLVTEQTDRYNWTFAYLGANQDALAVGAEIGFQQDSSLNYQASPAGVANAYAGLSRSIATSRSTGDVFTFDSTPAPVAP